MGLSTWELLTLEPRVLGGKSDFDFFFHDISCMYERLGVRNYGGEQGAIIGI